MILFQNHFIDFDKHLFKKSPYECLNANSLKHVSPKKKLKHRGMRKRIHILNTECLLWDIVGPITHQVAQTY